MTLTFDRDVLEIPLEPTALMRVELAETMLSYITLCCEQGDGEQALSELPRIRELLKDAARMMRAAEEAGS